MEKEAFGRFPGMDTKPDIFEPRYFRMIASLDILVAVEMVYLRLRSVIHAGGIAGAVNCALKQRARAGCVSQCERKPLYAISKLCTPAHCVSGMISATELNFRRLATAHLPSSHRGQQSVARERFPRAWPAPGKRVLPIVTSTPNGLVSQALTCGALAR